MNLMIKCFKEIIELLKSTGGIADLARYNRFDLIQIILYSETNEFNSNSYVVTEAAGHCDLNVVFTR